MAEITKDMRVEEVLQKNKDSLKVFVKYGIDTCCGSRSTIEAESRKRRVDVNKILAELNEVVGR
jgi:iron-sulfur cluster repair protein YtfE (RIC family)